MIIEVSYNKYQSNWYVGELYDKFYKYLVSKYGNDVFFTPMETLSKKNGYNVGTHDLSIFNIYNLIVTNKKTNKTFIHSFSDYAPAMMDDNSGILKFDVASFSCVSNLTNKIIEDYSPKYKIIPSFYILEQISDLDFIQSNFKKTKGFNKIYFNGLCYGHRDRYKNIFKKNNYFVFKNKSNNLDYLNKSNYFSEVSKYNFGFSLNGAAKICYRDLEYFGLGILCLRENLDIIMDEPLISGFHYLNIIDEDINQKLYIDSEIDYINDKINHKINDLILRDEYYEIINNAKKWYINNCLIDNQLKKLELFLIKSEII